MVPNQPMKVVILGGGGFIGSNLARRLVYLDHDVTRVDVEFPWWRNARGATKLDRDLTDLVDTRAAIRGADLVYHLAADMGGVQWFHGPHDWQASITNGRITGNVMQACTELDAACSHQPVTLEIPRLVYTSSACAYATEIQQVPGDSPLLAEDEWWSSDTQPPLTWGTPDAGYGQEKRYGLQLCERAPFDARVAICHTIYGPLQEHEGERMKFPAAVATKAIKARETGYLELWGDGRQMRSYLYVDDAVDKLVTLGFSDAYEGPVNVGASGAVTCEEVARMCLDIAGVPDAEIRTVPGPVGVMSRDCDNAKWDRVYGHHEDTSLRDGFTKFIDWLDKVKPETATRTPPDRAVMPAPEVR